MNFFDFSETLACFHNYINTILAKKINIFILVYLNDIFFYTKDKGQPHVNDIK